MTTALNKVRSSTRDQLLDQGLGDYDRLLALGQKNHKDLLAQAATLFRDRNRDLPELLQGISDTGGALGGRFKLMMYTQLVAIDRAEREYLAELRRIKSTAGEIVVASQVAGRKVRQRGQLQVATLRAREVGATARIDGLGSEAHAELDKHEVLPRDQAARFGQAVTGQMGEARGAILTQAAAEGDAELGMLAGTSERFGGIVDGKRGELGGQIDGALAQTISTFGESAAGMASQCAVDRSLALAMYATTFATFSAGSWAKLDEARVDWKQQADGFDATVNARAEASVAKHAQLVEAMPAKLDGVSKSTIKERHKSWLRRTLEGAWSGFKSFVKWAVIAIVVIGLAVLLGASLAVVLAIAAVVALGIALYHRFSALFEVWGDWTWQEKAKGVVQTLFASVGDLIGVTGMLEGLFGKEAVTGRELSPEEAAERFTVGALTLLTLGLIRAFRGKGGGAGRQPAGELPPGEAPPGEAPTTKPPAAETPGVEPRAGDAPGVEPTTREGPTTEPPPREPPVVERPVGETEVSAEKPTESAPAPKPEAYDALAQKHKLEPAVDEVLRETKVDPDVADSLLSRKVKPDVIAEVAIDYGPQGVRALDGLTRAGVEPHVAVDALRIGRETGTLPDVLDVAGGKLENAGGFRNFLESMQLELLRGQRGRRNELAEAADRARGGSRVSVGGRKQMAGDPESGQADVVDYTGKEAVQVKTVTSRDEGAVVKHATDAIAQLKGQRNEHPPVGFRRVVDLRITSSENTLYTGDRATLQSKLRGQLGLEAADADITIRIENGHPSSPFEFLASELM